MKRATGSNSQQAANKVSIRLALGGHSFSVEQLPTGALHSDTEVEVLLLTPRVILVPVEVFDASSADEVARADAGRELLAANGTPLFNGECAVWSAATDGIAAVMGADAESVHTIRKALGGREQFMTPLLHTPQVTGPTVWLHYTDGLLYSKVYDGGMQFAESLSASTEADILYFTELLGREFSLAKFELRIAAQEPKLLKKLIGGRFKRVVCENII